MTTPDIEPPDDLPAPIATALRESHDDQLRAVIHFAQELLWQQPPLTDSLEAREGERIVSTEKQDAYTSVVVEKEDAIGTDGDRFAYRVQWEPSVDGDEGRYRWHYLGRVDDSGGG